MSPDLDAIRLRLARGQGRDYWRSLEELAAAPEVQAVLEREFPSQRARFADPFARRDFLRLMGASLGLLGISACTQPAEKILPYAAQPETTLPGVPLFFATSMSLGGAATGLLVESHMGRPTKVEGNPAHPASLGSTDAFAQAQVHTLYDPDRSKGVLHLGLIATWDDFLTECRAKVADLEAAQGEGLALLTEPVTSPTLQGQIEALLKKLPRARWHTWTPLHRDAERAGAELAFGRDAATRYRFDRAHVVCALDADFLAVGPGGVRYARDFAQVRRSGADRMVRLYAVESSPTLTGAMADHRLALPPDGVERCARALAKELGVDVPAAELPPAQARFVKALATDLQAHRGAGVVLAGPWQRPAVHALCHAINAKLGNDGPQGCVEHAAPPAVAPAPCLASLRDLVADMREGRVRALFVLGGNPVYDAPADLDFAGALRAVPWRAHLALSADETSELCHWHVPEAHFLEAWSDGRAHDGTAAITQPLIAPLFDGKSAHELVAAIAGDTGAKGHDLVRAHWQAVHGKDAAAFERFWRTALHEGVIPGTQAPAGALPVRLRDVGPPPAAVADLTFAFRPSAGTYDGRFANNGWLQEMPRPLTRLTWDNAALVAPADAQRLGLANGDVVRAEAGGRAVEAPVWVMPGHPEGVVTLPLGYGRRLAGRVGEGVGFDAYALRTSATPWFAHGGKLEKTGARREMACVQDHAKMEGRDIVRVGRFGEPVPEPAEHGPEDPNALSLFPDHPYEGYSWGMAIDLTACLGCNACMIACQAENNIPVVGREEVLRAREMHWIRIDRYYAGDPAAPETLHQPVPCMHCERAPCELVCPVGATLHGDEGLNEMVYNRCVGTRYCSNNCPYKVRRFNFFHFSEQTSEIEKLGTNPDVTVRARGVMEKCTYCVQRINHARIAAKREGRPIRDGEIQTACQQVCPARAIVFGDLNNPQAELQAWRGNPTHYALLGELGTKPHTTYLAKLRNPNPALEDA